MKWFLMLTHNASPIFMLPSLVLLSTYSFTFTVYVIAITFIFLLVTYFCYDATVKLADKFFYSWTVTSIVFIFAVYQSILIPVKIVTTWENIFFFFTLLVYIWCIYRLKKCSSCSYVKPDTKINDYNNDNIDIKSTSVYSVDEYQKSLLRTYHCKICKVWISKHRLHSIWLDTCVNLHNRWLYLLALVAIIIWFPFASYLMLSTVCYSVLIRDYYLIPTDCSDVYYETTSALCFVCGVYSLLITVVPLTLIAHEIWTLSTEHKYSQECNFSSNVSKLLIKRVYEKWLGNTI